MKPKRNKCTKMRRIITLSLISILFLGSIFFVLYNMKNKKSKADNFCLGGNTYYFSKLKSGNNILLFWGSYCPHCEEVLEKIENADSKDLKDHLFTISVDEDIKSIKKWEGKFPIYLDFDHKIMKKYEVENIPTVFVISQKGFILDKAIGGQKTQKLLKKYYLRE